MADQQSTLFGEVITSPAPETNVPNNGNGRPKNARGRKHKLLQAMARNQSAEILQTVIDAAKKGDMLAAKIIFDRVWPKSRTAPLTVELPEVKTPAELRTAMYDLLQRVAAGEITTDDGAALVSMMKDMIGVEVLTGRIDTPATGELNTADPKKLLHDKLLKLIETRRPPAAEA